MPLAAQTFHVLAASLAQVIWDVVGGEAPAARQGVDRHAAPSPWHPFNVIYSLGVFSCQENTSEWLPCLCWER